MKYLWKFFLIISLFSLTNSCTEDNTTDPTVDGFKGYVYYSSAASIYRINMKTKVREELFTNAEHPDITTNGEILCIQTNPLKLMFTGLTGANRKSVMDGTDYLGPTHRRYMINPRISYDQKYIAYSGTSLTSGLTFVIDAVTGDLVATIGDFTAGEQFYRPSWAPDGSLYVQGWTRNNNGIYKVSSDFKTITKIDEDLSGAINPSVSPNGETIAYVVNDQLWTMDIDGQNPLQHYVQSATFYTPTWSPDSKYIIVNGNWTGLFVFDLENNTYSNFNSGSVPNYDQMSWVY